jgi:hypothetical protein
MGQNIGESALVCQGQTWHILIQVESERTIHLTMACQSNLSIHCHIMHIKDLDFFLERSTLDVIPTQFSLPVNFQHNPNLLDQGMKPSRRKGLKLRPSRDIFVLGRLFYFRE